MAAPTRVEALRRYSMGRPYTFLTEMITVYCRWTLCPKFGKLV